MVEENKRLALAASTDNLLLLRVFPSQVQSKHRRRESKAKKEADRGERIEYFKYDP